MDIFKKTEQSINKFKLFTKKDKIFVACSGGKDSTVMLYVLKKLGYKIEALTVNAFIGNYSKDNLQNIRDFCKSLDVPLHEISFREEFGHSLCYLRSLIHSKGHKLKSCTLCGVLRRYLINKHAKKLKASVLVTGHNLDDEAQSIVMNLFKNNLQMLARTGLVSGLWCNNQFVRRVKPFYLVREKEIEDFSKKNNFPVVYTPCPCRTDSFRNQIRILLDNYEKQLPGIKENIIDNYLNLKPKLIKSLKSTTLNNCKFCKEPAVSDVCRTCEIIGLIK